MKVSEQASLTKLKSNILSINKSLVGSELDKQAEECLQEYEYNLRGVNDAYNQFVIEFDAVDKD